MQRSINDFIQLITQDNGCGLVTKHFLQKKSNLLFDLSEYTKNPTKEIFIEPSGTSRTFIGRKRKNLISYQQIIRIIYINSKNGLANYDKWDFPKKLYLEFIKPKTFKEFLFFLDDYGEQAGGFSFFPANSEIKEIRKEYKKFGIKGNPIFLASEGYRKCNRLSDVEDKIAKIIKKINIDLLWKKQQSMKDFIEKYLSGQHAKNKILWLNKELENSMNCFTDWKNLIWSRRIDEKDGRVVKEIIGGEMLKNANMLPVYRVYGHFALCCLELFLDMQNDFPLFRCKECGKINTKKQGVKQKYCLNNKQCKLTRARKRKRKSDKNKRNMNKK